MSGLRPDEHPDDCEARSRLAHAPLAGLVVGCSGAAAVGALVVAVDCRRDDPPTPASVVFTVTVGLVLALRARTYVFTRNYGEAAAIEYFSPALRGRVLSGHNNYYLWFPSGWDGSEILVVGDKEAAEETVGVRHRADGDRGPQRLEEFVDNAQREVRARGRQNDSEVRFAVTEEPV